MNYFIVAGEVSGDLHGANLVRALLEFDKQAIFKGVGGPHLASAGIELIFGLDRLAFMGFFEVVKNLRTIQKNFKEIKQAITEFKPDAVILIDYPGFNLRLAKWCKQQGYKVIYYISPKFWAWREKRVQKVKKYVDLMLCILPFEKEFYEKHQYASAHYVGHPLLDIIKNNDVAIENKQTIALLPGSRKQEISSLLTVLLDVAQKFPNEHFVLAAMSALADLYPKNLPKNVQLIFDQTYEILQHSKAAIVCSGTATLETALFNVPQVVVYKTSWFNYQIGKRVAKVSYISLPNLIVDKKIIEERIQKDCNVVEIAKELEQLFLINNSNPYQLLFEQIGKDGASKNAAKLIHQLLVLN